jgi:hypothetical protein
MPSQRLVGSTALAISSGVLLNAMCSAPKVPHGLFDERDDVILSGHISSHEQGASTGRNNLFDELLSLGDAAAGAWQI